MKSTKKIAAIILLAVIASFLVAATYIEGEGTLTLDAVDPTPLDGSTAGRTFLAADRVAAFVSDLNTRTDAVDIYFYVTGAQGGAEADSVLLNIYGFIKSGPTFPIFLNTTITLGTATSPGSGKFADTAAGTDLHLSVVAVIDSGGNRIVRVSLDTRGLDGLYIEPVTFTGVTGVVVVVRPYGFVK